MQINDAFLSLLKNVFYPQHERNINFIMKSDTNKCIHLKNK